MSAPAADVVAGAAEESRPRAALDAVLDERGLMLAGYAVIVGFVVLFFLWGGTVPLASAAIAPGTIGVDGDKKVVQHVDGGVVDSIHVRDGDRVERGDVLLVLDDTDIRARHDELDEQWIELAAERARWEAEFAGATRIEPPAVLATHPRRTRVADALANHERLLRTRAELLAESRTRLERSLDVLAEENAANARRVTHLAGKRRLIEAELDEYRALARDGLATRAQLFELETERSDLVGELEETRSAIAVGARRRAEIESAVAELDSVARDEAARGASEARRRLDALAQQLLAAREQLEGRTLRAPVSGFVTASTVNTLGGVVAAGEPIMEIVPSDERLLVESQVDPQDRDAVRVGQTAEVRLSAFDRRSTPPLPGRVVLISADRLTDPASQKPYYRTLVSLDDAADDLPAGIEIHPGMQADVMIATGEQTFLDYLLSPVARSFERALRED